MTPEMIKLIAILAGGAIFGVGGQVIILKRKKKKELEYQQMTGQTSTDVPSEASLSQEEETARNYISQYKSQYPRESVKQGLLNYGISDENSEKYLSKYF